MFVICSLNVSYLHMYITHGLTAVLRKGSNCHYSVLHLVHSVIEGWNDTP